MVMNKTRLLFLIILIEGYVVLACELLAIRLLIPFVGSGTETISIIISAVLMPLAVGYHFGGGAYERAYVKAKRNGKMPPSVRGILLKNILSALAIFGLGLSYIFLELFFALVNAAGIHDRLGQAFIYSSLFLVIPVFLLGQTVPLVSNYFSKRKLSEITGKMLFFSTMGSFLGSVFSTIVLMMIIGVHNTVIVTLGLLCIVALLLTGKRQTFESIFCLAVLAVVYFFNSNGMMRQIDVVSDNAYNMVMMIKPANEDSKLMYINRSPASKVSSDPSKLFAYCIYIEKNFIAPLSKPGSKPRDILVIGAGGFTMGQNDTINNYTFVDIDPKLKEVAEQHFLPKKLGPNKQFIPASARAFLHNHDKRYDLIIIDTYTNAWSIPMETTTREFLLDTKKLLKDNAVLVANLIESPTFHDKFTVRYHNTFASVFPTFTRQLIDQVDPWNTTRNGRPTIMNVLYIYFQHPLVNDRSIYTDDQNTYSIDRN